MDLTLQNKKQNNIKVSLYHPNVQDENRRAYMQNCEVFVDLNWHDWMTPLNEFSGSTTMLTYVYFDRTEWNLQDFGL